MINIIISFVFLLMFTNYGISADEGISAMPIPSLPLTGTELVYGVQGGANVQLNTSEIATTGTNDPYLFNAAGTIGTTTGTISAGTNSLTVANASGWTVGMGIAITPDVGTTECISKVNVIAGLVFTLNSNCSGASTNKTVNHDDTVAISAAISASLSSGIPVHCRAGSYNYTSVFPTITTPFQFYGDGTGACILVARGKTNNTFNIEYIVTGQTPTSLPAGGVNIHDFQIRHAVAPTGGADFFVRTSGGGGTNVFAADIHDIVDSGFWVGIQTQQGVVSNSYHDIWMFGCLSNGILYGADIPSGYDKFNNILINGSCASGSGDAVNIFKGANVTFSNLTIAGGGHFDTTANTNTDLTNLMINNLTIIGNGFQACAIDFHGGLVGATILGGYLGGATAQICNQVNVVSKSGGPNGLSMTGVVYGDTSNNALGIIGARPAWTVANLPTCGSNQVGLETNVSDATAMTYGAAPVGTGTFQVRVVCLGSGGWVMQ